LHRRARNIGLELAKFNLESSEKINEVLFAYREIYVRNSRFFYADKISKLRHQYSTFNAEQTMLPNISKYIVELSITIGVLLISAVLFLTRDASNAASGLLAFMAAGSRIAPAILRLQQSLIQLQVSAGSADPTIKLLSELEDVNILKKPLLKEKDDYQGFESKVILKDLNFTYGGDSNFQLKNFNLEINEGEFVALVGPSGSGKSTLIDLILGLNQPTSGSVEISHIPPGKALETWAGAIGYVPQDVGIINGTIRENLAIGFNPDELLEEDFNVAIEQSGLHEFVVNSPAGLDTLVGERGTKLSGGQKQRLGIARALVTKPKLLILDEATSSLDGQSESAISNAIRNLKGSVTLIMIAHRLSTVRFADKVVYIENGSFVKVGTFNEVVSSVPNFEKQAKLMGL
jgi:ABC-type multidrug transport system fused ATPase/permease subunit